MNLRKRYYIAVSVSISCLLVSACLNFSWVMKNKRYETYLNETMSRNLKTMTNSIVNADVMLDFVVSEQTISREQVDNLYFQYHEFAYSVQELEELYVKARGKQSMFNPVNQYHFEIYEFFEHLRTEMDTNLQTVRTINSEELIYYKRLFKLTEEYTDIVQTYRKSSLKVSKDEWVGLLKQLSNVDNSGIIKNSDALAL